MSSLNKLFFEDKMKNMPFYFAEQQNLVIMDPFTQQDNDTLHDLFKTNKCASTIAPYNMIGRF